MSAANFPIVAEAFVDVYQYPIQLWIAFFLVLSFLIAIVLFCFMALRRGLSSTL